MKMVEYDVSIPPMQIQCGNPECKYPHNMVEEGVANPHTGLVDVQFYCSNCGDFNTRTVRAQYE